MPKGTRHVETGILRLGRRGYELEVDGGGVWRLDVMRSVRRWIGERVIVEGTRAGFDLLDVTAMRATERHASKSPWLLRLWRKTQPDTLAEAISALPEGETNP